METVSGTASVLVAVALVLAAVYLLSAIGTGGPTAAAVAMPASPSILMVGIVIVLGVTVLWHAKFRVK
ncbi:MAG: hypothetical protein V1887_00305 [Candidatus Aenigmatarchaeota archaeon]